MAVLLLTALTTCLIVVGVFYAGYLFGRATVFEEIAKQIREGDA